MAISTILLSSKGNAVRKSEPVPGEAPGIQTGATVTPGMLIEFDANYDAQPQQSSAVPVPFRVAVEQEISGMTIDDDYTPSGDFQGLEYASVPPGDEVGAWLLDGESVTVDDKLVSNGDGTLRQLDTAGGDPESAAIAVAKEAASPSGSNARIRVEVI